MIEMFQSGRILISIPPEAFNAIQPESIIFELTDRLIDSLEPTARLALLTVISNCQSLGVDFRAIMRPEICIDERVMKHAEKKGGKFSEHLCLSTGRTIKLIDGMRNYTFLYGLSKAVHAEAFHSLCRRAPEMVAKVEVQVNTALRVNGVMNFSPPTVLLEPIVVSKSFSKPSIYEWWMTRDGRSETQIFDEPTEAEFIKNVAGSHVNVVVVNTAAMKSQSFMSELSRKLHHALYFDEHTILQIPAECFADLNSWAAELSGILRSYGFKLPFLRTKAIVIAPPDFLYWFNSSSGSKLDLTLHHSDPIWSYNLGDHANWKRITIIANRRELTESVFVEFVPEILPMIPHIIWVDE